MGDRWCRVCGEEYEDPMGARECEIDHGVTTCEKCGTDHDCYEPGTYGAEIRCLRTQAEAMGATHLVDQVDAAERHLNARRDETLFRYWIT